jgi:hypothetical protein
MSLRQVIALTSFLTSLTALKAIFTRSHVAGIKIPITSVKACSEMIAYPTAFLVESFANPRTKQIIMSVVISRTAGASVLVESQG